MPTESSDKAKAAAAYAAMQLVSSGMNIGLGTGSTVAFFLEALAERCRQGLKIQTIASSKATANKAYTLGIPLAEEGALLTLDLTVDGADEIDNHKRLIKGGGGALMREKILASMARELVIIASANKLSLAFEHSPLPLEVLPFACGATQRHIQDQGFTSILRRCSDNAIFITDNGNYILDVHLPKPCLNPEKLDQQFKDIPGVLATGFFIGLAGRLFIGHANGRVEVHT